MKKLFTLTFILFSFFANADYWTQKADYPGVGLVNTCSFAIGNKGYISCGGDGSPFTNELWEYDQATNLWTQKANLPGTARAYAFSFSIGNKGYVGTGLYAGALDDFWEYDPSINGWTQKADFADRISAVGFSIGNMGYAGTGSDDVSDFNDFWQYNPATNTWLQKASLPGSARYNSIGFAMGNYGYIAGGFDNGLLNTVYQYNTLTNVWVQKASLPYGRSEAAAFSICDKGFLATGVKGGVTNWAINELIEYNSVTNTWVLKANYMGAGWYENIGFSIGTKGYLGLGTDMNFNYHNDFWEYTPDSACITGIEEELSSSDLEFTISPNPAKDYLIISYPLAGKENIYITITDVTGKIVETDNYPSLRNEIKINLRSFSKGIYFAEVSNGKQKAVKKFVKE